MASEQNFVRFWIEGEGGEPIGKWLVRKSEVEGLSPEQIKDVLGLQYMPTHYTDVRVPAGTSVREGIAGSIPEWQVKGGGFQTELMEKIPDDAFDIENSKRIGSIFRP